MRAVDRAFSVRSQEIIAGDIEKPSDTGSLEFLKAFAKGRVVVVMKLIFVGLNPRVGEASIFYEHNGGRGVGGAKLVDKGNAFFANGTGIHVRKAIDDINRRINFVEQVAHRGIHASVARETKVDNRAIKPSTQNGRVHHPRTRSTGSVSDGGAVENNGLIRARSQRCKL